MGLVGFKFWELFLRVKYIEFVEFLYLVYEIMGSV